MTEEKTPSSTDGGGTTDGDPGSARGDIDQGEGSGKKLIDPKDHQRAIDDVHKYKNQARESQEQISQLRSEIEGIKKKDLENKEDFKGLYESEKEARLSAEDKYQNMKSSLELTKKHDEVRAELLRSGLQKGAEALIDKDTDVLDLVEVEYTTQGRMIVHGADRAADKFKDKYPFAFGKPSEQTVNPGGGRGGKPPGDTKWDGSKLRLLEIECRRKGDMEPLRKAHQEFKKQRLG